MIEPDQPYMTAKELAELLQEIPRDAVVQINTWTEELENARRER
jgi:hypothetical protein